MVGRSVKPLVSVVGSILGLVLLASWCVRRIDNWTVQNLKLDDSTGTNGVDTTESGELAGSVRDHQSLEASRTASSIVTDPPTKEADGQGCKDLGVTDEMLQVIPGARVTQSGNLGGNGYETFYACQWQDPTTATADTITTGISTTHNDFYWRFVRATAKQVGFSYKDIDMGDDGVILDPGTGVTVEVLVKRTGSLNNTYMVGYSGPQTTSDQQGVATGLARTIIDRN